MWGFLRSIIVWFLLNCYAGSPMHSSGIVSHFDSSTSSGYSTNSFPCVSFLKDSQSEFDVPLSEFIALQALKITYPTNP